MKHTNGHISILYVWCCCWRTRAYVLWWFVWFAFTLVFFFFFFVFTLRINFRRYKQKQSNKERRNKWNGLQRKKKEAIGTLLKNALPLFNCNRVGQSQLLRRLKCEHFVIGYHWYKSIELVRFVLFIVRFNWTEFHFVCFNATRFCDCDTENNGKCWVKSYENTEKKKKKQSSENWK